MYETPIQIRTLIVTARAEAKLLLVPLLCAKNIAAEGLKSKPLGLLEYRGTKFCVV